MGNKLFPAPPSPEVRKQTWIHSHSAAGNVNPFLQGPAPANNQEGDFCRGPPPGDQGLVLLCKGSVRPARGPRQPFP